MGILSIRIHGDYMVALHKDKNKFLKDAQEMYKTLESNEKIKERDIKNGIYRNCGEYSDCFYIDMKEIKK